MGGWTSLFIWVVSLGVVVAGVMWLISWAVKSGAKPPMPKKVDSPYDGEDSLP